MADSNKLGKTLMSLRKYFGILLVIIMSIQSADAAINMLGSSTQGLINKNVRTATVKPITLTDIFGANSSVAYTFSGATSGHINYMQLCSGSTNNR